MRKFAVRSQRPTPWQRIPTPWHRILIGSLVLATCLAESADAQVEEDVASSVELRALREEIELLRERLEALESERCPTKQVTVAATVDTAVPPTPLIAEGEAEKVIELTDFQSQYYPSRGRLWGTHFGSRDYQVEVGGFLDLEYIDTGGEGARSGVSTFDNHHVNVFLRSELRPNLQAHIELEYEHAGDTVEVDQAFLAWGVDRRLTLKAGRFYTPFGIERFVWYSPANALVSRPEPMRQIVPGNFYADGVMASSIVGAGKHRFQLELALSNGLGDDALLNRRGSRQTRDNNSNRALTGRLAYTRWPYFEVGVSHHRQRYSTEGDLDLEFLGFDLATRWRGFELRSEWVEARIEQELGLDDVEQAGWYAQAQYTWEWDRERLPSLSLVSRWNDLDLDRALRDTGDRTVLSLGLNFEVYSGFRWKIEAQLGDDAVGGRDTDAWLSQVAFEF